MGWPGIHSLDYGGTYWLCSVEILVETDFLCSGETGCLCSEVIHSCFEDSLGATRCLCFLGWRVSHFLCFLLGCESLLLTHSCCFQRVKDFDSVGHWQVTCCQHGYWHGCCLNYWSQSYSLSPNCQTIPLLHLRHFPFFL